MEIKDILENEFLREWEKKSGRKFPLSLTIVESSFDIQAVTENINKQISSGEIIRKQKDIKKKTGVSIKGQFQRNVPTHTTSIKNLSPTINGVKVVIHKDPLIIERYNKFTLNVLTRQYVNNLYSLSLKGISVDKTIIELAKRELKMSGGDCPVHPC